MQTLISRNTVRTVARSARQTRSASYLTPDPAKAKAFAEEAAHAEAHAAETTVLWRRISNYVCAPAMAVTGIWVYFTETEHLAHLEHIRQENGGKLPDPPAYDYLNKRQKPFPWGMNSLFFNPKTQKDMSLEE
ncbi:hypothetical protein PLICRDRAFT_171571 [Plicaturopsis crispa FD-325 SS-3]|nr:hypothetical protein PLICRDRAFT_171571 [Plicaturopsis crispa FD-325 SS-3]